MKTFTQLREASITTMTDFDEYPIDKQAKAMKLKVKKMKGKGDAMMGPDKMTLTGSESDLIKYFVKYMGADKRVKFTDLKKEFNEAMQEGIAEAVKAGKGKGTADVDYIGDKDLTRKLEKKFKIKIKQTGTTTADIMGDKKNVLDFLMKHYYYDASEVEELHPEILA